MAFIEEIVKTHPAPTIGVGLAVVMVPVLFPSLRPQWASAVKSAAKLFFEAEGGAEGEVIDHLAKSAIDRLADAIAQDDPGARDSHVSRVVSDYRGRARRRSERLAWNEGDRSRRYGHHLARLRSGVRRRKQKATGEERHRWESIEKQLDGSQESGHGNVG